MISLNGLVRRCIWPRWREQDRVCRQWRRLPTSFPVAACTWGFASRTPQRSRGLVEICPFNVFSSFTCKMMHTYIMRCPARKNILTQYLPSSLLQIRNQLLN
uniref:Uncharacterized protein n=1 Tax=Arundo donax TaxID=35708 RepID=A0A0A8YWG0_ARUDO